MKWVITRLIRLYQLLFSSWMPPVCRFYPSCSRYAVEAVEVHGVLRGLFLATWRVLRCNPFNDGGVDPVPREFSWPFTWSRTWTVLSRRRPASGAVEAPAGLGLDTETVGDSPGPHLPGFSSSGSSGLSTMARTAQAAVSADPDESGGLP